MPMRRTQKTLKTDRDNIAAQIMLGKLDPATLKSF